MIFPESRNVEAPKRCLLRRKSSFVFCVLYVALVFGGQHYMKTRPKLNLRRPLILWSLSLAIFR